MAHMIHLSTTLGLTSPGPSNAPKITFAAKDIDVLEWNGDFLAVGVTEKDVAKDENSNFKNPLLHKLDVSLSGLLAAASSEEDFSGKSGQSFVLRVSGLGSKRIGLFGLGQSASSAAAFVGLGEAIAAAAKTSQAAAVAVALAFSDDLSDESKPDVASAIAIGIVIGIFDDNRYRSDPKKTRLQSVDVLGLGSGSDVDKKLKYAQSVSSGIVFGKELVNSPANILTPGELAAEVIKITTTYNDVLSATIFNKEEIIELKMGSYLGVTAAATANPPKFIHLCYKPPSGPVSAKLGLVGKGITFDSGGYNLKAGAGSNIETMKNDMGGAAAIFGAAKAIAEIKPLGVEIHFVVAACENMISATGMRPSDIVTASNGKTIEVNNTDAEGRLCLADALIYTCKQGVEKIIDLATLTGACITALGPSVAGAFTPNEDLAKEVFAAAERSGEKLWRLPLEESYWESMKSSVADMINTGPGQGGAITAALFLKQISFGAKDIDVLEWKGDLLAVGVTEKDVAKDENSKFKNPILNKLDSRLGGLLAEASAEEDFTGKAGQSTVLRFPGLGTKRVGLIGLGQSTSSVAAFRGLGEAVASAAKASQASEVAISLASPEEHSSESKPNIASAIASGTILGIFEDSRYKSESKKSALKSVEIIGLGSGPEVDKKLKYAQNVSSGIILGRELVNSPANVLTPGALAAEATKIASTYSDVLSATILNEEQCKELNMGSYLGVSAASTNPPHFIHLRYKPPSGPVSVKLGLVGKGLTFDSGGYNIKTGPGCSIEIMKTDMGGAAAVLGAAKAIGQIKPLGVEIHFVIAACENMISGTGMRPGDIITASNGKTIEVNNTDAEGRLTLADALVYTCKQGVDKVIDLATLTGACVVALGPSIAGVFTPSDDLAKEVLAASETSGEKFWRMPMEDSYWESMKSSVADMVNTGGRPGGAITAALFLKQFVDEKVQWMHIDVAGPVFSDKKRTATGFGVATLVEWVRKNAAS